MFQQRLLALTIAGATLLTMVGCNSNDHDSSQQSATTTNNTPVVSMTTITVTPSLGKITKGRVILRNAKTGDKLAPAKNLTPTDNGVAKFTIPVSKLADPILAAVLPATDGKIEYFDEAIPNQTTTITVPTAQIETPILRAAASVLANANVGVTALTEAAVQQAVQAVGGLTAQNINAANAQVKNQLKLNFDITQAPVVVGVGELNQLINSALTEQSRAYAAYLATLAKEAKRINPASTSPALDMAKAFADDFANDGKFDAVGSQQLAWAYDATFMKAWVNWVNNFYSAFSKFNNIDTLNTWLNDFNAVTPTPIPTPPVVVTPVQDTCASKNLSTGQLSNLTDFVGGYLSTGIVLGVNADGSTTLNAQTAPFKEVCAPVTQSNGTNVVLITQRGSITLFKDTQNVITAEGKNYSTSASGDVFFATKQATNTPPPATADFSFNASACIDNGQCGANVMADFQEDALLNAGNTALSCSISKRGAIVTATSDGKSVSVTLNNGLEDTIVPTTPSALRVADTTDSTTISKVIQVTFNQGKIETVTASDASNPDNSIVCLAKSLLKN